MPVNYLHFPHELRFDVFVKVSDVMSSIEEDFSARNCLSGSNIWPRNAYIS
jgi:hypothetical protein